MSFVSYYRDLSVHFTVESALKMCLSLMCLQSHTHPHQAGAKSKEQANKQTNILSLHALILHLTLNTWAPALAAINVRKFERWKGGVPLGLVCNMLIAATTTTTTIIVYYCSGTAFSFCYPQTFPSRPLRVSILFFFLDSFPDLWFVILCIRFHLSGQSNYCAWHFCVYCFGCVDLLFLWPVAAHLLRTRFPAPCGKSWKVFQV